MTQDWHWERDDLLINPSGVQSFGAARIDMGDIDGDSWLDLVVLDSVGMRMYRNQGLDSGIAFERHVDWEITPLPKLARNDVPTLGDLNGDGRADLILPNGQNDSFKYWRNTGNVSTDFWTRADSVMQGLIGEGFIALADLDGDHDLDAVTYIDSALRLYWNAGDSLHADWHDPDLFPIDYGRRPNNIRFADVNDDGLPDIFAAFEWAIKDALVSFAMNTSTPDSPDSLRFTFPGNSTPLRDALNITIAVGDIEKDQKVDLLTGHALPHLFIWHSDFDTVRTIYEQTGSFGFPFGHGESGIVMYNLDQNGSGEMILVRPELATDIPPAFLTQIYHQR